MYRIHVSTRMWTLYRPFAAAVTALMHHTQPSCTPAVAATATFARGQHEDTQKQLQTHVDAGANDTPYALRGHGSDGLRAQ